MAGAKAVWGIDIGQCALKAIKLTYDAKEDKAVVAAFDFVEHPKILSQPDAEPEELIRSALEQFLSRNDLDDSTIVLSVPGQAGLARFVKLPPVEAKKVGDIVRFEANQQIPFNLNDVSWDYQTLGSGEETEGYLVDAEVGIFAMKKDAVNRYLAPLERQAVEVGVVQLAPVALYNFAAFDQFLHSKEAIVGGAPVGEEGAAGGEEADAPKASAGDDEEAGDTIVILDIGADNTDLVVTNGSSIWLRNLPIGGNHFTRALTKELKLTFAKAEHMKRNATKAPDPKKLYQAMRPVFQDFVSELQRSIGFFSSTNRTRVIRKVIGVGNGFKLPGLQKFLQQHLSYEVERVNGFHGLTGDPLSEPVFQENLPSFCLAYGLALQGLKQAPLQTNLLPRETRLKRMIRDKKPYTLVAAAAVLVAFVSLFIGTYNAYSAVMNKDLVAAKAGADKAVSDFGALKSSYGGKKGEFEKAKTDGLTNIGLVEAKKRLDWIKALRYLNEAMPKRGEANDAILNEVAEVNVDFVNGSFLPNTGDWFGDKAFKGEEGENAKKTMTEEDRKGGPSGEGWVYQLLGYTYYKDGLKLVRDGLLKKLQDPKFRERGFTHACIFGYERNRKWTPKSPSWIVGRPRVYELLATGVASDGGGRSSGANDGGGRGGALGGGGRGEGGDGGDGNSLGGVLSGGGRGGGLGGPMGGGPMGGRGGSGDSGMDGGNSGGLRMPSGGRGGRGGRGGMSGDEGMMDGGRGGLRGGTGEGDNQNEQQQMDDLIPPELRDALRQTNGEKQEKGVERTDFEIHVVWTLKKEEPKK